MPAVRRNKFLETMWSVHKVVYKATGGRLGGRINSMPVLLLTTTGRKSDEPREVALSYLPDGQNMVIIGSNVGENRHPAWVLNLRSNPAADVRIKKDTMKVEAREADAEERARLWAEATRQDSSYSVYEKRTKRVIPVVVLEPRPNL